MFQRALLFVNGDLPRNDWLAKFITSEDYLIAVDGGLRHLLKVDKIPHLLIGDLDSVSTAEVARMNQLGVEIRRYPTQKDETDLELALWLRPNKTSPNWC
jgi:thiamine pyrophosphokinase